MLTILNDVHLGALRSAGTTETSKWQLRLWLLEEFKRLLPATGDLMILGDLFDTGNIPVHDVLETYKVLLEWFNTNSSGKLYNVAGNHDLNKSSNVMSSFQFLGKLLKLSHSGRYIHIEEPTLTGYGYVIPHLRNQDLFDLALNAVPECDNLFLHVNYDNHFAAQSDQSLNISKEQVEKLKVKKVIIAHEHHAKQVGKVLIPGNQIASSVSDWLTPGDKMFAVINGGVVSLECAAKRTDQYVDLDWEKLEDVDKKFVRISGTVQPDNLNKVLSVINKFRASSSALVVTNAVKLETDDNITEIFSSSLEGVQAFSIKDALKKVLTESEYATIEPFLC